MVDAAYQRLLDKHEKKLDKAVAGVVREIKKSFSDQIKAFNNKVGKVQLRIFVLEMDLKKRKEEYIKMKNKKEVIDNDNAIKKKVPGITTAKEKKASPSEVKDEEYFFRANNK